jgi:hypothetical protein
VSCGRWQGWRGLWFVVDLLGFVPFFLSILGFFSLVRLLFPGTPTNQQVQRTPLIGAVSAVVLLGSALWFWEWLHFLGVGFIIWCILWLWLRDVNGDGVWDWQTRLVDAGLFPQPEPDQVRRLLRAPAQGVPGLGYQGKTD